MEARTTNVKNLKKSKILHPTTCSVCGDSGSGVYYGVTACFGCKGFFRRTTSQKSLHICRYHWKCDITKEGRNKCKACRYRSCLKAGMRKDDARNHREKKSKLAKSLGKDYLSSESQPSLSVPLLIEADNLVAGKNRRIEMDMANRCITNIHEVFESLRMDLITLVEWSQKLPCFLTMEKATRVTLLRTHSMELIYLEMVRRSLEVEGCIIIMANGTIAPCTSDAGTQTGAEARRMTADLLKSCKVLKLTNPEILCLKALLLFDPQAVGLSDKEIEIVGSIRHQISVGFEMWVTANAHGERIGRVAEIMLLLQKIQRLSETFTKIMETARKKYLVTVPKLVDDLIIQNSEIQSNKAFL